MRRKIIFLSLGLALLASYEVLGEYRPEFSFKTSAGEEAMEKRPVYLYKVLTLDDWAKSREEVHLSSMDADFIHFSTEEQLSGIIAKYWSGVSEYVVLKVETSKLRGELILEANPGGTNKYYHLYHGSIPLSAVKTFEKRAP
ncbi:MAG TPA: DUF952 domain-containing protein [Chlamydiales bacterium]|nr:DUF952 domain-containing protein [Chlamydiales bacterium]